MPDQLLSDKLIQIAQTLSEVFASKARAAGMYDLELIWRTSPDRLEVRLGEDFARETTLLREINNALGNTGSDNTFANLRKQLDLELALRGLPTPEFPAAEITNLALPANLASSRSKDLFQTIHPLDPVGAINEIHNFLKERLAVRERLGQEVRSLAARFQLDEARDVSQDIPTPPARETGRQAPAPDTEEPVPTSNKLRKDVKRFTHDLARQVAEAVVSDSATRDEIKDRLDQMGTVMKNGDVVLKESLRNKIEGSLASTDSPEVVERAVADVLVNKIGYSQERAHEIAASNVTPVQKQIAKVATAKRIIDYTQSRDRLVESSTALHSSVVQAINQGLENLDLTLSSEHERDFYRVISRSLSNLFESGKITPQTRTDTIKKLISQAIQSSVLRYFPQKDFPNLNRTIQENLAVFVGGFHEEVVTNLRNLSQVYDQHAQVLADPHIQPLYAKVAVQAQESQLTLDVKSFLTIVDPTMPPRLRNNQADTIAKRLNQDLNQIPDDVRISFYAHLGPRVRNLLLKILKTESLEAEVRTKIESYLESHPETELPFANTAREIIIDSEIQRGEVERALAVFEHGVEELVAEARPGSPKQLTEQATQRVCQLVLTELTQRYYEEGTKAYLGLQERLERSLLESIAFATGVDQDQLAELVRTKSGSTISRLRIMTHRYLFSLPNPSEARISRSVEYLTAELESYLAAKTDLRGNKLAQETIRLAGLYVSQMCQLATSEEYIFGINLPLALNQAFQDALRAGGYTQETIEEALAWMDQNPSLHQAAYSNFITLPRTHPRVKSDGKEDLPLMGQALEPVYYILTFNLPALGQWAIRKLLTPVDYLADRGRNLIAERLRGEVASLLARQGWHPGYALGVAESAVAAVVDGLALEDLRRNIDHLLGVKYINGLDKPKKPLSPADPRIIYLEELSKAIEAFGETPLGKALIKWNKFLTSVGRWPTPASFVWGYKKILLWNTDMALRIIVENEIRKGVHRGMYASYRKTIGRGLNEIGVGLGLYKRVPKPGYEKIKFVGHIKLWNRIKPKLVPRLRKLAARILLALPKGLRRLVFKLVKKIASLITLALSSLGTIFTAFKVIWNKFKDALKLLGLYLFHLFATHGLPAILGAAGGLIGGIILGAKVFALTLPFFAFLGPFAIIPSAVLGFLTGAASVVLGAHLGIAVANFAVAVYGAATSFLTFLSAGAAQIGAGLSMVITQAQMFISTLGAVLIPSSVAAASLIIVSGAFFSPSELELLPGSRYFNVVKTAEYQARQDNSLPNPTPGNPQTVTYRISINPPQYTLRDVRVTDATQVFNQDGQGPRVDPVSWEVDEIAAGETHTINHPVQYTQEFADSVIFNTVTVTADVVLEADGSEIAKEETKTTSLVICVGECPLAQAGAFSIQLAKALSACACGDESLVENSCTGSADRCQITKDNFLTSGGSVKPGVRSCLQNKGIPDASIQIIGDSVHRYEYLQCVGATRAVEIGSGGNLTTTPYARNYIANPPSNYEYIENSLENTPVGGLLLWEGSSPSGAGSIAVLNSVEGDPDFPILVATHANVDGQGCLTINNRNTTSTEHLRGYLVRKTQSP